MKNAIKTLMLIVGLLQGDAAMATTTRIHITSVGSTSPYFLESKGDCKDFNGELTSSGRKSCRTNNLDQLEINIYMSSQVGRQDPPACVLTQGYDDRQGLIMNQNGWGCNTIIGNISTMSFPSQDEEEITIFLM